MRLRSIRGGRQGDMNDCWLVAAMTLLATEAPHYIRDMLVTKEISAEGKYVAQIHSNGTLKTLQLDDYFPCFTFTVRFPHDIV